MIRTMHEAVKFLEMYIPKPEKKFPKRFGLIRMRHLCEELGNPEQSFKAIHVGGTSGKGSTATIIASILSEKYKVGLHVSPHVEKINERIQITQNNALREITNAEFIMLVGNVVNAVEVMKNKFGEVPSYFELTTALAFLYFKNKQIEVAVIEVGMGGTFDATNVITPIASVLTNVGLDHTEILGNTVEKIARDKSGIIKKNTPVITAAKQPSVLGIFEREAKKQDSSISILGQDFYIDSIKSSQFANTFAYHGQNNFKRLSLRLLGEFQLENAALALRAIEESQIAISQLHIKKGLLKAFIPGRLEIIASQPIIILDGAHNIDKVRALLTSLKHLFPDKKIHMLIGIKNDKKAPEMLQILCRFASTLYFTSYSLVTDLGKTHSFNPLYLKNIAQKMTNINIHVEKNSLTAFHKIIKNKPKKDIILVTGSLYLVGELRKKLKVISD